MLVTAVFISGFAPLAATASVLILTRPAASVMGKILLADGTSFLLLTDGTSELCRAGGC